MASARPPTILLLSMKEYISGPWSEKERSAFIALTVHRSWHLASAGIPWQRAVLGKAAFSNPSRRVMCSGKEASSLMSQNHKVPRPRPACNYPHVSFAAISVPRRLSVSPLRPARRPYFPRGSDVLVRLPPKRGKHSSEDRSVRLFCAICASISQPEPQRFCRDLWHRPGRGRSLNLPTIRGVLDVAQC